MIFGQAVIAGLMQFVAKRFGAEWTEDQRIVVWPNVEQAGHVVNEYVRRLGAGWLGGRRDDRFSQPLYLDVRRRAGR